MRPTTHVTHSAASAASATSAVRPQASGIEGVEDIEEAGAQSHEIISCSRRTDVPANYMPWLLRGLEAGEVTVHVRGCVSRVSLRPEDVKAWVWWSKDYGPWLEAYRAHPELLARYRAHLFHFTITGLEELESVRASLDQRIAQIGQLARIGHVVVRFDPVTRYRTAQGLVRSNESLIEELIPRFKAAGAAEVAFKFCVPYAKILARMRRRGTPFVPFSPEEKRVIVRRLMAACAGEHIVLKACCPRPEEIAGCQEAAGLPPGVPPLEISACVDGGTINRLLALKGESVRCRKDYGQRKACKCAEARDIGDGNYQMRCAHNCAYCYASPGETNEEF